MFKRILLGSVLATGLISGAAAQQTIEWYSLTTGAPTRELTYTGDLSGGPFAGDTVAQLFSLPGVNVAQDAVSQFLVLSSSGVSSYTINGNFGSTFDPTLSGGLYGGQTLGQAYTAGVDMDLSYMNNYVSLFGSSGLYQYSPSSGALSASYDTTLSGGAYNGLTVGQVFSGGGVTLSAGGSGNTLGILSSSGISYYSLSTGAFSASYNPTLTGSGDNGLTLGQAYSEGLFLNDIGGTAAVALIAPLPEPPTWMLMLVGGAMLVGTCWFRRRPNCPA